MYSLHAFLKSKLEEEFETEFRVFSPKPVQVEKTKPAVKKAEPTK